MALVVSLPSLLLFSLIIASQTEADTKDERFSIGVVLNNNSRVGKEEIVAMKMAMEDFSFDVNQSFILDVKNSDSVPLRSFLAARDLLNTRRVEAIIGLGSWEETSLVAEIGNEKQIPIISLSGVTPKWSTEKFPFLVEASKNQIYQMKAIASIIRSWGWYLVSVIYEDREYSATAVLPHLSSALIEVGARISQFVPIPPANSSSLSEKLKILKRHQCRVFVVHMGLQSAVSLFQQAKQMKMMEKEYVWITTDFFTNLFHSLDVTTFSTMQGVIGVKSYFPKNSNFSDFRRGFRRKFSLEYPEEDNNEPGFHAVQAYDAAKMVALAMKKSVEEGSQLLNDIQLTRFQGLTGEILLNSRKLEPSSIFQIVNVMGRSYQDLGFWSETLGFSKSLEETEDSTYESSMKNLGQVIWPGSPWYTPKGWMDVPNTVPLRIGVPTGAMFEEYVKVEQENDTENNVSVIGLAVDVFKATLEYLPFDLRYRFYPFNGSYNDLVKNIQLKQYDAVVGDVKMVAKRYEYADYSHPYSEPGLVMVVPVQSNTRNKGLLFLKPFTRWMWILTAVITIYNGFVVWLIERNHNHDLQGGSRLNQTGTWLSLSFTTLVSLQARGLHSNLSRMAMVTWLFVALIITQIYTANLASLLTAQRLEPTVSDIESLKATGAKVGYCTGTFFQKYLVDVLRFDEKNLRNYTSPLGYAEGLNSKEIAAAFMESSVAKLFLAQYCDGFTIAGPTYKVGAFGFAFPKGSPLVPKVTEALLKLSESGKLIQLEHDMIAAEICHPLDSEDEDRGLSPNSFWVLLVLTGGTSTFALLAYVIRAWTKISVDYQSIRRLILSLVKYWGRKRRRFSKRISDVPQNVHPNHPNEIEFT